MKKKENYEVSISKEQLNALPTERFSGEIIVVDEPGAAEEAIKELEKVGIIGFDTETKPAFQKGQINQVALLQLSTGNKGFLFRLSKTGMLPIVKALLENDKVCKVGLSIKDDFHSLSKICEFKPQGFIDLQEFVKKFNISDCSLTKIHAIVFGKRISKSQQLSNWEASNLTPKQQEYAALDAQACLNIFLNLSEGGFDPQSSTYRRNICEEEKN